MSTSYPIGFYGRPGVSLNIPLALTHWPNSGPSNFDCGRVVASILLGSSTHFASGALAAGSATVAGTAVHPHVASGTVAAASAAIAGSVVHPHVASGAVSARAAAITATAVHPHIASGALVSGAAQISGDAISSAPLIPVPHEPQTLFAQMWKASVHRSTQRAARARALIEENERLLSQELQQAALVKAKLSESFPAPRETTPEEMAGYTATAAAIVKADLQRKFAEQARLIEQARIVQAQEALRIQQAALQLQLAREQEEMELLLLLS